MVAIDEETVMESLKKEKKVKCSIDPAYKRYFKLKKMGMPIENVKMKMTNEGFDSSIIDQEEPDWDALEGEEERNEQHEETVSRSPPPTVTKPEPEPEPEPDPYTPPTREKTKPNVPMRQLYWSIVQGRSLKDTVWENMATLKSRPSLGVNDLEQLFEVKKQTFSVAAVPTAGPTHPEEEEVSFVDAKKETNIGIGVRKLRYSGDEVKRFLLNTETFSLSQEALSVMVEILPKEDECMTIRATKVNPEKLSFVNAFLYSVAEIPNCMERVNCLLIRATFAEEKERIVKSIEAFLSDCTLVRESEEFLYLLSFVLEIGNYMNGESVRGGACGYHLDILSQLERTKSNDNAMTLIE